MLQQHFPESLSELWFLNAPFIFWGLWRVVKPFIQPGTRDKIRFLSGSERAALLSHNLSKQARFSHHFLGFAAESESLATDSTNSAGAAKMLWRIGGLDQHRAGSRSHRPPGLCRGCNQRVRQGFVQGREHGTPCDRQKVTAHACRRAETCLRIAIISSDDATFPRRFASKAVLGTWGFARDHNPVWAARIFGSGVKRAVLAIPRPGRHSQMNQHATLLAERVSSAWQQRPSLPRPNYRYQRRTDSVHLALLDVVAFYVIAVRLQTRSHFAKTSLDSGGTFSLLKLSLCAGFGGGSCCASVPTMVFVVSRSCCVLMLWRGVKFCRGTRRVY